LFKESSTVYIGIYEAMEFKQRTPYQYSLIFAAVHFCTAMFLFVFFRHGDESLLQLFFMVADAPLFVIFMALTYTFETLAFLDTAFGTFLIAVVVGSLFWGLVGFIEGWAINKIRNSTRIKEQFKKTAYFAVVPIVIVAVFFLAISIPFAIFAIFAVIFGNISLLF
jgi:polyferredoxin